MAHMAVATVLRRIPAFSHLGDGDVGALVDAMRRRHLALGDQLFEQGDLGGTMHLVVDGELSVRWQDGVSDAELEVARIGPGEFVGEMALLDLGPRSASIVARRETVLYELAVEDLLLLEGSAPAAASAILSAVTTLLTERIRHVNRQIEALVSGDAPPDDTPRGLTDSGVFGRLWSRLSKS